MAERVRGAIVLSEKDVDAIVKVKKFFDLYFELVKLVKSMSDKEFRMLERSLELTAEEMKTASEI